MRYIEAIVGGIYCACMIAAMIICIGIAVLALS